ncbi:mannosylglycerate hydrolase [Clostridium grantii]|uniref:Mannosylglycerate hydrolase n=1 Tax=Clostridium grantii DSM 8605 TaxID=1121316 RepID=A0A1M5UUH8_9CLOT|nr:mannosylglycerate hydrolase [Clostridium grantii]SHH66662.1 mannosylglycerate hydrolase [Clostridium grantii DSM 8605]
MKKVHVVPHMHWDREWYFTTEESRILLVNNMEEILEMLETNENYPYFVMDGQTAIIEDYLEVKPENKERLRKLVQAGKLIIGPWYTQTDEMIVAGESIVRNLLYGIKDCEEFGDYMKIGYLPDSFGQSAQMPQILNGFDIKHSMFWRGTSERHGTDKTEFNWVSDEGSKVLVQLLPLGYAIGKYLPQEKNALKKRMDKYVPVLDKGATTEHQLLPNGHDQMPIQKDIFEVMEKLKEIYTDSDFFLSKFENVFEEIEKNKELDTLQGEFLDGKYMRVHRSIYSTRMDIKTANARIENKITNILEPLATIAYSLGFDYHHGLIEKIWKEIMKNHAHDSIGSCCSDKVHKEIMGRFFLAEDKTDRLIDFYMRKIADAVSCEVALDKLVAYNLLPYNREQIIQAEIITKMKGFKLIDENNNEVKFEVVKTEVVDAGLIDRQIVHYGDYDPFVKYTVEFKDNMPAVGYKTYLIVENKDSELKVVEMNNINQIETEFYIINVNENGTIKVQDKKLGKTFENVLLIEDGADDGDEYDFSPLLDDYIVTNENVKADVTMTQNEFFGNIDINYSLNIPKDIESRKKKICDSVMNVKISLRIPMNKASMEVNFNINNQSGDHRVRAYVPTAIKSGFSVSDNQFGSIERPVIDAAMEVWEKERWNERPDSIYPMMSFVGLSDEEHGVAVLTNSTREFEIVGNDFDTIAITLFRTIGFLGREEMLRRPGRPSGIKLPTPDSQMIGNVEINFAIATHEKSTLKANVARIAKEYLTPVVTYNKMPYNAMKLNPAAFNTPYEYSLFTQNDEETVLSVLKKSEKDSGIIVRYYNATEDEKLAEFSFNKKVNKISETNLNEKIVEELVIDDSQIEIKIKKNQVKTILVQL